MVVSSVPGAKVGADGNDAEGAEAVANGGAEFDGAPPVAAPNKFGAGGVWPSPVLAAAAGEAGAGADVCCVALGAAVAAGAAPDESGCAVGGATSTGAWVGGFNDAGTAATRSGRLRSSVDR